MSMQNGRYDQASLVDAFQALLRGETVRVRVRDQAERGRLRAALKRNAALYGLEARFRTEPEFLTVRERKPQS